IAQLVEDVRRLQASLSALQEAHSQQLRRLEERLDEKKQHIARLEARLDTQRDYDDIKREISDMTVTLEVSRLNGCQCGSDRRRCIVLTDRLVPIGQPAWGGVTSYRPPMDSLINSDCDVKLIVRIRR
ncbi:Homeobox protein cut-like 1, partial [Papilio xuthus]